MKGKLIFITGATSGIGEGCARKFAAMGSNLILNGRNTEKLEALKEELTAQGVEVLTLPFDVRDRETMRQAVDSLEGKWRNIDVLINNAGLFFVKEIANADRKQLSSIMMVHNYTPLMLCREFVPGMKARGHGYVLNISSLAAWLPWPALGMYSNTKRFIKGFSRSLRLECRGSGVSVTTAYFGAVDTPLYPLKPSLRRLAVRIYVMIPPRKAAEKALRAMFKGRKGLMPGLLNHIFRPIVAILPDWIVGPAYGLIRKHVRNL